MPRVPLTDPIGEPLTEVESLIPGLAPTFAPQLPGIKTSKPFLYQTPGESETQYPWVTFKVIKHL